MEVTHTVDQSTLETNGEAAGAQDGGWAMTQVIGRLNGDDLLRWRKLVARDTAIHIHPPHWSREEICHHLLESQQFRAEVAARFEVDDTRSWRISAWTGVIWYDD